MLFDNQKTYKHVSSLQHSQNFTFRKKIVFFSFSSKFSPLCQGWGCRTWGWLRAGQDDGEDVEEEEDDEYRDEDEDTYEDEEDVEDEDDVYCVPG